MHYYRMMPLGSHFYLNRFFFHEQKTITMEGEGALDTY